MLGISKCFAKSEFQTFEPNSEIGTVNERTIKLLQTSSQHYYTWVLLLPLCVKIFMLSLSDIACYSLTTEICRMCSLVQNLALQYFGPHFEKNK